MTETNMETSISKCPYCGKEYPMIEIPSLFKDAKPMKIRSSYCGCDGELKAERDANVKQLQMELTKAWKNTDIPEEFWGVKPDFESLKYISEDPSHNWIYYHGQKGTGKTTDAACVLKAYVRRNQKNGYVSAKFIDLPNWLASMRRDWGSLEEDGYQRAAGVGLLVLDDLGKGKPTDWAMERVFRLINDRYNHRKPTIITSQYDLNELGLRCAVNGDVETAEAVVSRIIKRSKPVYKNGPDRRLL